MVIVVAQQPSFADGSIAGQWRGEPLGQTPATPEPILIDGLESQGIQRDLIHACISSGFTLFAWEECHRRAKEVWAESSSGLLDRKTTGTRFLRGFLTGNENGIAISQSGKTFQTRSSPDLAVVRRQLLRRLPRNRPTEGLPSRSRERGRGTLLELTTMPERLHQKQQFAGSSSVARSLRSSLASAPPRAEANVPSRSANKSRRAAPH